MQEFTWKGLDCCDLQVCCSIQAWWPKLYCSSHAFSASNRSAGQGGHICEKGQDENHSDLVLEMIMILEQMLLTIKMMSMGETSRASLAVIILRHKIEKGPRAN